MMKWLSRIFPTEYAKDNWLYDGIEHQLVFEEGEIYLSKYTSSKFKRTGWRWSAYPRSITFPPRRIVTRPPYNYPPMNCSLVDAKMTAEKWAERNGWKIKP